MCKSSQYVCLCYIYKGLLDIFVVCSCGEGNTEARVDTLCPLLVVFVLMREHKVWHLTLFQTTSTFLARKGTSFSLCFFKLNFRK